MEDKKSLFPPKSERTNWGWFGYEGTMCDRAIKFDRPDMLQECIERGWLNANSVMLDGKTILQECEAKAPKCAEALRKVGQLPKPVLA